jgi:hypothetical protein
VLLQLAATGFDVLLTVDRNMEYQQNFANLTIAVIAGSARRAASATVSALDLQRPITH